MTGSATRDTAAPRSRLPWEERLSAFLAIKLGKRPGDATLEYIAEWAPRESLRREAARVLAKRKARNV